MGFDRISRHALALILVSFVLTSCGGMGVATRDSARKARPGASDERHAAGVEAEPEAEKTPKTRAVERTGVRGTFSADDVEAYFADWLETPYLFGGEDFSGVDCSGLVGRFFSEFYGIDVPRTTSGQYAESKPLSESSARPGDLIFFKNTYRPGISHVGIYLGDGRFVHASNSGVIISDLTETYYKQRFAGYRRFTQ